MEGLRMQSIRFDSATLIGTESLRRMAEDCAPRFSSLGIGLGSDAIGVLGSIGNLSAFGDLHAEMRIHVVVQESGVGSRATRWYYGDGPPPTTLQPAPVVGDFYLDRLSGQVYELAASPDGTPSHLLI